jgi:hypothetical protein
MAMEQARQGFGGSAVTTASLARLLSLAALMSIGFAGQWQGRRPQALHAKVALSGSGELGGGVVVDSHDAVGGDKSQVTEVSSLPGRGRCASGQPEWGRPVHSVQCPMCCSHRLWHLPLWNLNTPGYARAKCVVCAGAPFVMRASRSWWSANELEPNGITSTQSSAPSCTLSTPAAGVVRQQQRLCGTLPVLGDTSSRWWSAASEELLEDKKNRTPHTVLGRR